MAILSDLVESIAEVEDIDPATIGLIARYIREAGLIATHGRGPSAAKMSATDAANLLIGVNATSTAVEAPRVVRAYRRLHASEAPVLSDPSLDIPLGTLGEAIEQLLHGAGRGELAQPFAGKLLGSEFLEAFARGHVHIELRFCKSEKTATLRMTECLLSDEIEPEREHELLDARSPDFVWKFKSAVSRGPPADKIKPGSDRIEETTIGYRTLHAVGRLIG